MSQCNHSYSSLLSPYYQTIRNHSSDSLEKNQGWSSFLKPRNRSYFNLTVILRVQKAHLSLQLLWTQCWLSPSLLPLSSLSPVLPPCLMPPRLRVDSASLWQLLITGWPGPAALCMTASRPAQVTQSEGETERDGEKGGWAGQRKTEEQEEEEERRRREKGRGDRKRQKRQREGEREK